MRTDLWVSHLAQLLHSDHAVSITIKEFEGLLETLHVLPGELPVRAQPLRRVLGHDVTDVADVTEVPGGPGSCHHVSLSSPMSH